MNHLLKILLLLAFSPISAQQIWLVDQFATGANNGTSWENAYTDLQLALSDAAHGDQIWVAKGIYLPTSTQDRTISFNLPQGVKLYGGFSGTETALEQRNPNLNPTVLSGDIGLPGFRADNSYHVLTIFQGDSETAIDGFTITLGYAEEAFSGFPHEFGGGLLVTAYAWWPPATPVISNCNFVSNRAGTGGGLAIVSDEFAICNPTINQCRFTRNLGGNNGGGLYKVGASASNYAFRLTNCVFEDNRARYGAGMYVEEISDSMLLSRCTFSRDTALLEGGGMHVTFGLGSVYAVLDSCIFYVNRSGMSSSGAGLHFRHSVFSSQSLETVKLVFKRCDFWLNKGGSGCAIDIHINTPVANHRVDVLRCKFRDNIAQGLGSAINMIINRISDSWLRVDRSHFIGNQSTGQTKGAISVRNTNQSIRNWTLVSNSTFMYNTGVIYSEVTSNSTADIRVVNSSTFRNGKRPFAKHWYTWADPNKTAMRTHVLNSIVWEPQVEGLDQLFYNEIGGMGTVSPFIDYTVAFNLLQQPDCVYNNEDFCGQGMLFGTWPEFIDTTGQTGLEIWGNFPGKNRGNNTITDTFGLNMDFNGLPRVFCDTVDLGAFEVYCLPNVPVYSPFEAPFIAELLQNPVPVGQALAVDCWPLSAGHVRAQLLDMSGRLIWQSSFQLSPHYPNLFHVPTEDASTGLYYLKLMDERGNGKVLKALLK